MSLIKNLVKEPEKKHKPKSDKDEDEDGDSVKEERKRPIIKSVTDLQRLKVEKLMKNPEKPIIIPETRKEKDYMQMVPSFVRNVMGSSAGAGSGEFHVYRHLRRKEYARQKIIQSKSLKEQLDDDYQQKLENNRRESEEKTAKKRAKRMKKKQRAKKSRSSNIDDKQKQTPQHEEQESESSDDDEVEHETIEAEKASESHNSNDDNIVPSEDNDNAVQSKNHTDEAIATATTLEQQENENAVQIENSTQEVQVDTQN